jgi:hypothetical protein
MSRLIETGADVMSSLLKIWLSILILISVVLAVGWYALFHGYFDHGQFEIKQSQWSSTGQVAMLAERSDHEALGDLSIMSLSEIIYSLLPSFDMRFTVTLLSSMLPVTALSFTGTA